MAKNDIDGDISLGENDIDRDISLAENDIDREGQQQDKSRIKYFFNSQNRSLLSRDTLSLAGNVNVRDPLFG